MRQSNNAKLYCSRSCRLQEVAARARLYALDRDRFRTEHETYYEKHRETMLERSKARYKANPGAARAYREANREAAREHNRAYYQRNKEVVLQKARSYRNLVSVGSDLARLALTITPEPEKESQ